MRNTIFPTATLHPDGFYEIDPPHVPHDRARIIDVREHSEHAELAPHDAAEIVPLGDLANQALTWDRSEPLVVACRSGARSGRAARALEELGFSCVVSLRGGMTAYWQQGR